MLSQKLEREKEDEREGRREYHYVLRTVFTNHIESVRY